MENLTELPTTAQASLLLLNEYCLLEIFDFLKLEDSMNLSETCIYLSAVANRTFKKYSSMRLGEKMAENGKACIHRFFTHFGHRVLSLVISSPFDKLDCWRIARNCESLTRLKMCGMSGDFEHDQPLFTIDRLELLSFVKCNEEFIKKFLNIARKVIVLIIDECQIECNGLMTVLRNSPDMENFQWLWNGDFRFDFHLLEMISNVGSLSLAVELKNVSELDPLLKLNRLSDLKLSLLGQNINSFLSKLAKKGIIEQLTLRKVAFDENFFEMLKSFDSLQVLVLNDMSFSVSEIKSSIIWPPKLKFFRFVDFAFTLDAFLSTIKQLKYLENICLKYCWIVESEKDNFNDVKKLSQQILFAIADCNRKQRLDVVLPKQLKLEEGSSKKFLYDSERLRIYSKSSY